MKNNIEDKLHIHGLVFQIYRLVILSVAVIGIFTYFSEKRHTEMARREGIQTYVGEVSTETIAAVKEFPAYSWLLRYWYSHADTMDIEYDVNFVTGKQTKEKCAILNERYSDLQLRYVQTSELRAMSEEDQKLYAEIAYSWLITRINQIKASYHVDFLYCIVTDGEDSAHPFEKQYYLFSAAVPGAPRGTAYHEVYPLGVVTSAASKPELQEAMREAVFKADSVTGVNTKAEKLDESGGYMDAYVLLDWIEGHPVLVGASFELASVMKEVKYETRYGTFNAMIFQFLLSQLILLHLFFYVVRPLQKVQQNIRHFTEYKDSAAVRSNISKVLHGYLGGGVRKNEIGRLAVDFSLLTEEMDEHVKRIETITAENERIEVELEVASRLQSQMLPDGHPDLSARTASELCATMNPAKEVGGDFYDYFFIDDTHLALVMADVSNKGVPAALFMVRAKSLIKNRANTGESPGEILYHVNNQFCEGNDSSYFVTVWLAIVDLTTGKGVAVNAGHEHPVLRRAGGEYELVEYRHSPIVGALEDTPFRERTFELHPGDRLFVYTDGVPEATDTHNKMFGTERMLQALNEDPDAAPDELLRHLRQRIDEFVDGAPQFDDITMMCFWYK